MKKIGVLALQGSFFEHLQKLKEIGARGVEVRSIEDTQNLDALIIPGGESTVLMKLLRSTGLDQRIKNLAKNGLPIYGTCAGMIVLSKGYLSLMDIEVKRNAYGRQLESFEADIQISITQSNQKSKIKNNKLHAVFIRAPKITTLGPDVQTLATHNGTPVLVQQNNLLAGSFHPELAEGVRVYEQLLNLRPLTSASAQA